MSDTGLKEHSTVSDIYLVGTIKISHPELKGTLNNVRHWFKSVRHLFNRDHKMSQPEIKGTLNNVTC